MDTESLEKKILKGFFKNETICLKIQQNVKPEFFFDSFLSNFYILLCEISKKDIPLSMEYYFLEIENPIFDNIKSQIEKIEIDENEIDYCINQVKEEYSKQLLLGISSQARIELNEGNDIESVKDSIMNKLISINQKNSNEKNETIEDSVKNVLNSIESGYEGFWKTGIPKFDNEIGGIEKDTFWVIAAAESIGKTAFALFLARKLVELYNEDVHVVYFSLEMSTKAITLRIISSITGIETNRIKEPQKLSEEERQKLNECVEYVKGFDLMILDKIRDVGAICNTCRYHSLKYKNKKCIYIIDNLDKISSPIKEENVKIADITGKLLDVKNMLSCNVILLHHVNKEAVSRANKENYYIPQHGDVRGSGKIADNADIVTYLGRPDRYIDLIQYCEEQYKATGQDRFLIQDKFIIRYAKNREGKIAQIVIRHNIEYGKFY